MNARQPAPVAVSRVTTLELFFDLVFVFTITQLTDASGVATFLTIYPGWYQGRAVHIHVKVHVQGGDEEHTGQLFFDDAFTASVYAAEPYAERGQPDTPNDADGIYAQSEGSTIVAVERAGDGYAGAVTLGVRAT